MTERHTQPLIRSRLGALDPLGWAFLGAGVGSLGLAIWEAANVAGGAATLASVVLFGTFGATCLYIARAISRPEVDTRCRECQARVLVDSARGDRSAAVAVQYAGRPGRLTIGPVSVVRERDRNRVWYCSPVCARADLGPLKDLEAPIADPDDHERAEVVA